MGHGALAKLAPSDLAGYRAALGKDGRAAPTHVAALSAVRSFLRWTAAQGLHAVEAEEIRILLRGWRPPAAQQRRGQGDQA